MKVKHKREEDLIEHYNDNPKYWSFSMNEEFILSVFNNMGLNIKDYKNILDVGCGRGELSTIFTNRGLQYEGVDYSEVRINLANELNVKNATFHLNDIYSFLDNAIKSNKKYDIITIFEVLEHLEEPNLVLDICKRLLTDNGAILASVPHNMPYKAHLQVYIDEDDVKTRLKPIQLYRKNRQYFCKWYKN